MSPLRLKLTRYGALLAFALVLAATEAHGAESATASLPSRLAVVDRVVLAIPPGAEPRFAEACRDAWEQRPGQALPFDVLSEQMEVTRRKLEATRFFRAVDVHLEKSVQRDHYVLMIGVEPISSEYVGASLLAQKYESKDLDQDQSTRRLLGRAFGGSRSLFGTDAYLDLELLQETQNSTTPDSSQIDLRFRRAGVTLVLPRLAGTGMFLGVAAAFSQSTQVDTYPGFDGGDGAGDIRQTSRELAQAFGATVGRKIGLFSASVAASRSRVTTVAEASEFDGSSALREFTTTANVHVLYSEKPFLSLVEPGLLASADYERTTAPEVRKPAVLARLDHTWLATEATALTPSVMGRFDWNTFDGRVLELFDGDLLLEHVGRDELIMGLGLGGLRGVHLSDSRFRPRAVVSFRYQNSNVILDVSVVWGQSGLRDYLLTPDPRRVLQ